MSEELLKKYREGHCSSKEIDELLDYFIDHPSEIEKYFTEEEWTVFYEADKEPFPDQQSQELYNNSEWLIDQDRRRKKRTLFWISGAIAASMLLLIGFNFFKQQSASINSQLISDVKIPVIRQINSGNEVMNFQLPDGSKITLYPGSEVQYDSVFGKTRNIYLTGKGKFDVIHDTTKVFKVWCRDVVTTDIGTIFIVDGLQNDVRVDLLEGKASVAKVKDEASLIYLLPGQFAIYNNKTSELAIGTPPAPEKQIAKTNTNDKPSIDASLIKVQNTNLKKVLNQLSAKYNISIEYPLEKINRSRINIAIDTSLKVEAILKNIALLSNLQLVKESDSKYLLK